MSACSTRGAKLDNDVRPQGPDSRKVALNFLLLTAGEFAAKLLTFAAFFYLARALGAEQYGSFEFVLAVMVFFTLPADMGLGAYGARELARDRSRAKDLLREIIEMRMVLAAGCLIVLLVFITLISKSAEVKLLLALYGVSLLVSPLLLQWLFQAYDQMQWVALASILRQGLFAALVFLFLRPGTPLLLLGVFECIAVAVTALFCVGIAGWKWRFYMVRPRFQFLRLRVHVRQAVPIGATELAWAFMWYFATVLLGLAFSDHSLGWFGASHRMLMALHTFVWLYFFNLLPSISRCVPLPHETLIGLMRRSVNITAWSGIFVAFLMTVLAREALTIAYGPAFAGAATCFALLVWMLPIAMLSGHHRYILIAYGQQKRLLRCTILAAVVAVVLGFVLVPMFGAPGAAVALLCANATNFIMAYRGVSQLVVPITVHQQLVNPLIALVSAALAHHYFATPENAWIAAAIASAAYGLILVALERRQLKTLVGLFIQRRSKPVTESLAA
jgi:O-antigen/teichoic acid export membrane protein